MTPEIKHRIEQIKNGIIPKGYKKTFDGFFPNDWETVRLGDIFKERVEKGREDLPLLSITGNEGVIPRSQISRKDSSSKDKSKYLRICKGDIGYNTMRMWQGVSALSNYEGIVSPAYTVLKPTDGVCTKYFAYLFKTEKNIFKFYRYSQGLVDDTRNLKYNSFKIIQVTIPPVKEQQKIVAILSAQDKVIECYEKKIEQLKQMKKYYLQNMFPKHGETVPKIRFKGFTEPWEQRRISEILSEKLTNGVINFQSTKETDVRHINVIDMYTPDKIHTDELSYSAHDDLVVKKCNVKYGDIFLTRSSLKPEGIAKPNVLLSFGRFVFDDHLIKLKIDNKKYDPYFVKICLESHQLKKQFIMRSKTTAFTTIGQNDIAKCNGFFPDISEQRQIASLFSSIDELITLHQRELEEEKKKKKALQQLLLTGIVRTN